MTRAKRLQYLTHAAKRTIKGRMVELSRLPFLMRIEKYLLRQVKNEYKRDKKVDIQLTLF